MRGRVIIIHDLDQARAALTAATEAKVWVTLATAPGASAYLGPTWTVRAAEILASEQPAASFDLLLDCGDAAGHALAALRAGAKLLRYSGPKRSREKLEAIARQSGATMVSARLSALDLGTEANPEEACRTWLALAQTSARRKSR